MRLQIRGSHFIDDQGRMLHLRGVNLAGSSKVPRIPDGATWNREGFYDYKNVNFVGRPFLLDEADEHFSRLKRWGFNLMRFVITWEAIEHEGPGIYDQSYLDYLYQVVKKAGEYDLYLFIDPHQDVWSRFSGGDGAPGWTFDVVGMDITKFNEAGAAITHQEYGDPIPRLIWVSNYSKYACATMWTLFFGGNLFASQTLINGIPVEEYLQGHYFEAIKQVAARLKEFPHVIGYENLNEPSQGYIGYPDVNQIAAKLVTQGPTATIYQGMLLASGYPQEVQVRSQVPIRLGPIKRITLNQGKISIWKPGAEPVWKQNGVWDVDSQGNPHLLLPDHFGKTHDHLVDFDQDCLVPFVIRFIQEIRSVDPQAFIFVCPPAPEPRYGAANYRLSIQESIVHSPHWYDGVTMGIQKYIPWIGIDTHGDRPRYILGRRRKRRDFVHQVHRLVKLSNTLLGGAPTVIGESGIPYNLNKKSAYQNGNFSQHIMAWDDTIQALEANLVNFTLWNYTPDNSNLRGDQWNEEDLSIFSLDQQSRSGSIHDGGRALEAIIRPYAYKIPGRLLSMSFDIDTKIFECSIEWNRKTRAPMEIFIPDIQYPDGFEVLTSGGTWEFNPDFQTMEFFPTREMGIHHIRIAPKDNSGA